MPKSRKTIVLDDNVSELVKQLALREHRSFSQQIQYIVKQAMLESEKEKTDA